MAQMPFVARMSQTAILLEYTGSIMFSQSALTDFLAANNISAAQIRSDYENRRRATQQQPGSDATDVGIAAAASAEVANDTEARDESVEQAKKRRRKEQAAIAKIKKSKEFQKRKLSLAGEPGEHDNDGLAWDMYTKSKPVPGQLENCELCAKRFTVTPYSKEGPDGGLLCAKCSKEVDAEKKKETKAKKPAISRDKRRKVQSNLLDGLVSNGAKTLQELCVEVGVCEKYGRYQDEADSMHRK